MSNKRNNDLVNEVNTILNRFTEESKEQSGDVESGIATSISLEERRTIKRLLSAYESATYKEYDDRHSFYQMMVSDMTNDFGFKDDELADRMANEHPTLQQSFMRFVCKFIRALAKKSYTDGRNERAVALAKKLVATMDEDGAHLPMV